MCGICGAPLRKNGGKRCAAYTAVPFGKTEGSTDHLSIMDGSISFFSQKIKRWKIGDGLETHPYSRMDKRVDSVDNRVDNVDSMDNRMDNRMGRPDVGSSLLDWTQWKNDDLSAWATT